MWTEIKFELAKEYLELPGWNQEGLRRNQVHLMEKMMSAGACG